MSDLDDIAAVIEGRAAPEPKLVPRGAINSKTGVWEGISRDTREALECLATEMAVEIRLGNYARAWKRYYESACDAKEQVALWTLLDSKQRTALKRNQK